MAGQLTIDDLRQILVEVAGEPDPVDTPDDQDIEIQELGYDSIAVLAAVAKIERDRGVKVDEEGVMTATMLSDVVELINLA